MRHQPASDIARPGIGWVPLFAMIALVALSLTAAPVPADGQQMEPTVREVLARFDHEPTVQQVQQASLRWAYIHGDRVRGWFRRARVAGVLPESLEVDYEHTIDDNERSSVTSTNDIQGETVENTVRDFLQTEDDVTDEISVSAEWEPWTLIWNDDVLDVSDEARDIVDLRQELLTQITSLYYERRQRQVEMILDPPDSTREAIDRQLSIDQLTANIDALTGGWFVRELGRTSGQR